ncbi:hypothetical protein F4X86_01300 [Candidatus Saccharibacteria bacterium]|nr:hypothetical protein [Candidatus Saccharibacteria bacterium]
MKPIKLDQNFLDDAGLKNLPADEKLAMLAYVRQTLEVRVGERLAKGIPDELLQEFYGYARQNQPDKALAWIQKHAPDYSRVVREEVLKLRLEVKLNAESIIKHSRGDSGAAG